ncbi:MAG: AAA family ATPase [Elusimicrobiota bacterium]
MVMQPTSIDWINFYDSHIQKLKVNENNALALCPFHNDTNPSFSINLDNGQFQCFGCSAKGNGLTFADKKGIPRGAVPGWITYQHKQHPVEVATYDYRDEDGKLLYQVVRYEPKKFLQRRPNAVGGWQWGLNGTQRVLYRLPELVQARIKGQKLIFIVEGEKDVDNLRKLGITATCNSGGAGKWPVDQNFYLKEAEVVILPDKDEPGRSHAQKVAQSLVGLIQSIKILELPGHGKDVSDWIGTSENAELLLNLVSSTPIWIPKNNPAPLGNDNGGIIFKPKLATEFILETEEQRQWIWEGYIPQGGLIMIAGSPKAGKTTFTYHLIRAITAGEDFLDLPTRQCQVLLLALEEHSQDVRDRINQLQINHQKLYIHQGILPANSIEIAEIEKTIRDKNIELVVIDTLARFWAVKDENNASDVGKGLTPILNLCRRTNCAILLLHHTRKSPGDDGSDIRGSGDIFALMDIALIFKRRGEHKSQRVLRGFSRYPQTPDESVIELNEGIYSRLGDSSQVCYREQENKVLKVLTESPTEAEKLAELAELKPSSTRSVLNRLFKNGLISRQGKGVRGNAHLYSALNSNNSAVLNSLECGNNI